MKVHLQTYQALGQKKVARKRTNNLMNSHKLANKLTKGKKIFIYRYSLP